MLQSSKVKKNRFIVTEINNNSQQEQCDQKLKQHSKFDRCIEKNKMEIDDEYPNLEPSFFQSKTKKKIFGFLRFQNYSLQKNYYCFPSLNELNQMQQEFLTKIQNFVIGNDFAEIRFLQPVDLSNICLQKAFDLQRHQIEVYPKQHYDTRTFNNYVKRGLNRQAILIYKQFFDKIPKKSKKLETKIEHDCLQKGLKFVQICYSKNELWFLLMQTEDEEFEILLNQEEANFIKKILPPQYFLNQVSKQNKNKYLISSEKIQNFINKNKDGKQNQNIGAYKKCQKILNALKQHRSAEPFLEPVDPIALGIPTYFETIKNPMDLSSVETKFRGNRYKSPYQFFQDIELIWKNAFAFNLPESEVYMMCQDIEREYLNLKQREFGDKLDREKKLNDLIVKFKKLLQPQEKEEEIKYLEPQEFIKLAQNITQLPNKYIYGVIEIIQLYHPEYNFNVSQEINLESLSDLAVYKVFKYVNRCQEILNKKKQQKKRA